MIMLVLEGLPKTVRCSSEAQLPFSPWGCWLQAMQLCLAGVLARSEVLPDFWLAQAQAKLRDPF